MGASQNNKRKSIKSIKGEKIHPHSRKAQQINRCLMRASKLDDNRKNRQDLLKNPKIERLLYFKHILDDDKYEFSLDEMKEFVNIYISRNQEELDGYVALHRKGQVRPKANREDLIKALQQKDTDEFRNGFWIPDLRDSDNVKTFKEWEGDINCVPSIKLVRIFKDNENVSEVNDLFRNLGGAADNKKAFVRNPVIEAESYSNRKNKMESVDKVDAMVIS